MLEARHEQSITARRCAVLVVDDARYVLDVVTDMLWCNGAEVTASAAPRPRPHSPPTPLPVGLRELIDVVAMLALKEQSSGWLVDRN